MSKDPLLSVIVVFFNMGREAERTLYTLSAACQKDAAVDQYEVIAVDNGSTEPLNRQRVESFGENFHYCFHPTDSPSPVAAINQAVDKCRGSLLMVMIDGAHMVTPGVIGKALRVFRAFADPFVTVVGFHLGPEIQNSSVSKGYNQEAEDALLETLDWRQNGYNLFKLGQGLSYDCAGWFGPLMESNCFFMRRESFLRLGGFDPRFTEVGGGLAILDLFQTAVTDAEMEYVVLLGEGSFHQFHGGVASNAAYSEHPWRRFHDQYEAIKGRPFQIAVRRPVFFGGIPPEADSWSRLCALVGLQWWEQRARHGEEVSPDMLGYAMAGARAAAESDESDLEQKFYALQSSYDKLNEEYRQCKLSQVCRDSPLTEKLKTGLRRLLKVSRSAKPDR